jgi:SHS2 domain-containing protein
MKNASHSHEEHTGEMRIRLEAPTLAELFAEAARALMEVMGGATPAAATGPPERATIRSLDRDALLVDWLNELVYRVETEKMLYGEFVIEAISDRELIASLRGAPTPELRSLVKAASFHGLKIVAGEVGFSATVVLDV